MYYKNRKCFDHGSGTGIRVTLLRDLFKNNVYVSYFTHCNYESFKGTLLNFSGTEIFVSNDIVPTSELDKLTNEECWEFIFSNISVDELVKLIDEEKNKAASNAVDDFKEQFRKLMFD